MDDTEKLKTFSLLLVFVSAAGCVYYFLLPSGNISKTAKRILSVFLLSAAVFPLFSLFSSTGTGSLPFAEPAATAAADTEPLLRETEAALRREAERIVRNYTETPCEIRAEIHITEDYGINLERLTVTFERDFPEREAATADLGAVFGAALKTEVKDGDGETRKAAEPAAEG